MRRFVHLILCPIFWVFFPGPLFASDTTVKVGIYENKPKVFVDSAGEPQGVFVDILNCIASKEGWQLNYVASTWEKNLEKLEKAEIEFDLAKDLKIIHADSGQIEQIILNLALNASHAMPGEGKMTIETRNIVLDKDVRTTNREPDSREYVLLKISDTGHGIEKEVQHRIFEPFFTTKEPGKGTGLGLSMVYSIVKNHHGHIECDSAPGAGTRFNIYFPVSTSANALNDEMFTKKEKLATGNETILVIEDDESVMDALKKCWSILDTPISPLRMEKKQLISSGENKNASMWSYFP